ncbi:NAD(P)/FAD-dependent oxidoreductase [Nocardioides sp. T2.26MG-1]|uniref:NAD(P)/FAD-dependent oxidoreductase n=1 Tax=Nocardioides sp. T2.26MG-1 TaxID=3041166 RepID=UPI00253F7C42|nr:NAD(P)/FAD-dependent oxidoreductase [Nocardioides sp. T2.26MG-1]
MNESTYDVIVLGGGPAGLQAALTLGRVHRRVLLLDSQSYRNDPATHLHNFLTHDGTPPSELRAAARAELAAYATVAVRDLPATAVRAVGTGFHVDAGGEAISARGLVLATGLRDLLPDKPGLAELFGDVAVHCPFCHGHELAGRPVAILGAGPRAAHLVGLIAPIASRITVLTDGAPDDVPAGVDVRREPVTGLCRTAAGARVSFDGGPDEEVAGVFVSTELSQAAPFAEQLGLTMLPSGCVEVDAMGRTSLAGVHAAGDLAHQASLPGPLASVLSAAAAGQVAAGSLAAYLG